MSFKQGVICYQVMFDKNGNPFEIKLTTENDPKIHIKGYMGLHIDEEIHVVNPIDMGSILNFIDQTGDFDEFKKLVNTNTFTKIT